MTDAASTDNGAPTHVLQVFGPAFGMPDPSPFCMKAMSLLKIANIPFQTATGNVLKAPKKKLPVLIENGQAIADTTLIRFHLEHTSGIEFDRGLDDQQRGIAWAAEKLCEDNLYWAAVYERWIVDENFEVGPKTFFNDIPAIARPVIVPIIRRDIRVALKNQGLGRHSREEILAIARRGIDALAGILGDQDWIGGDQPCGADAMVHSMVANCLSETFETDLRTMVGDHRNLVAYRDRGFALWYPDFKV
ncbi:MAG: glutathione S-transferase family protein [Pseudomonadota bacterium]